MNPKQSNKQAIKVWDIWVRLTHWLVAIGVFVNLVITEEGGLWHKYIGYAVVALVLSRLVWGLIGTPYARFSQFFPTPTRLWAYLHTPTHTTLGHNPVGAVMMFILWALILALGITGYLMNIEQYWGIEWVEEVHEVLAQSLYVLIPLHIIAAVAMSWLQRQNLVKAMITGQKYVDITPTSSHNKAI